MKSSEIVRLLVFNGWYLDDHGANHDLYRHPTKPKQIAIPRHKSKELKKGIETKILKDAGLK